jgi:hypothetical protein
MQELSFFLTSTTGDAHADFDGLITPFFRCSFALYNSSPANPIGVLFNGCLTGAAPPVSILCLISVHVPTSFLEQANALLFLR